jgi:succinate dehydrogenase flavin-adding protein (antitoxin of CptAB toxin-antitoxin module)
MENMYFSNKDLAKVYVETLEPFFINRMKLIAGDCKDLNKLLKDVVSESNELYECLDILSEDNNIHNISKKINARENFIKFLTTKKSVKKEESTVQFENHTLLNTVLVGNFNTKFTDFLNEEQKETFSKIMSMSNEELINEMSLARTELNSKIENLLGESTDDVMVEKLKKVKIDINESEITKYNYYKLTELKNGLIV